MWFERPPSSERTERGGAAVLIAVGLLVTSCASASAGSLNAIDFDDRRPAVTSDEADRPALRVAVAAVLSPEGTIETYAALADYLGEQLGMPAVLIQRRTYAEVNALVAAGEVDLAFVCTSAYVKGSGDGTMDLLVVPEIGDQSVYRSAVIVPITSQAHAMADLRGGAFAFTDPMSLTGRAYPTSLVHALGMPVDDFFAEVVFTYSHDDAVRAVAHGLVDGAGVDELVLQHVMARDPDISEKVRVINLSPEYGIPPVVVPSTTSTEVRERFTRLLVGLSSDFDARPVLTDLGIDRFVVPDVDLYDSARLLMRSYGEGP